MSMQPGSALTRTIPGEVITPDAVLDPASVPAHAFFNVMRDLVHRAVYHTELEKNAALDVVDTFERRFIPVQDRKYVVLETDMAGREDVSQRVPPRGGHAPLPSNVPVIDYARLAAAIVAAQSQRDNRPATTDPTLFFLTIRRPP